MSDFDLSNFPVLPAEPTGELREKLGRVKYVFTDLDATMLAPGSCALSDNEGNPSTVRRSLGCSPRADRFVYDGEEEPLSRERLP